jgi:deoxyribodipyrimidine photo-lyase
MPTHPLKEITIFWFRRDLRLHDNAGLYHALRENKYVLPLFIYDTEILEKLENKADRRVEFINTTLFHLQNELKRQTNRSFQKTNFGIQYHQGIYQ